MDLRTSWENFRKQPYFIPAILGFVAGAAIYIVSAVLGDTISRVGLAINTLATVGLFIYKKYSTKEEYNSFRTAVIYYLLILVGNTLWLRFIHTTLFDSFSMSLVFFIGILILTKIHMENRFEEV
ncbi:hypothetical protein R9C00_00255 [Flammeovirgaceae bacterium SG7u.111]|nr:hypothetical protein [Flammeovirgaceae bacterium SG7u.132]WPO35885.1 hypothetical protein R9C00_00255 [Flammeovirgaceae bacterium SG7u.111]